MSAPRQSASSSTVNTNTVPAARLHHITETLKGVVTELTGIEADAIDIRANFLETGVDSLMLIQAVQVMQDRLGIKLSVVQLLEELTSIDVLAEHIDAQLPPDTVVAETTPDESAVAIPAPPVTTVAPPVSAPVVNAAPATAAPSVPAPSVPASPAPLAAPVVASVEAPQTVQMPAPSPAPLAMMATGSVQGVGATELPPSTALEQLMAQQLQVMAQQLEMLRGGNGQPATAPRQPMATAEPMVSSGVQAVANVVAPAPSASTRVADSNGTGQPAASSPSPVASTLTVAPTTPSAPVAAAAKSEIVPELFNPYQPIVPGTRRGLSPRQQEHLDALIARYTERTKESKRITQQYRPFLADSRASAGFKLLWKEMVYPIVGAGSRGSRLWDVDGNEYVDLTMGFGLHLLGHSPDLVVETMQQQLQQGIELGPQIHLAGKVCQLISELTGVERVNICNSGTEAVMGALRVARTMTRRNKIALFAGAYHGWSDGTQARPLTMGGQTRTVPNAPGVQPQAVEDVLVLDWNDPRSLDTLREQMPTLAAVLVEPVQSRRPDIQPKEFLQELRRLTEESGTALIFDEMVTGFRIGNGGAQAHFGITADLVIYGKVLGAGLPVGVVAGKAKFMDAFDGGMWQYGDGSYPPAEKTLFAGAYFKHPLTMATAWAILNHLKENPGLLPELNRKTEGLVTRLNAYFEQSGLPIHVAQYGSLFRLLYPREFKHMDLFFYHLLDNGVFLWEGRNCFVSAAHTEEDFDIIIAAIKRSVEQMRDGGFFPELPPSSDDAPSASASTSLLTNSNVPAASGLAAANFQSASVSAKSNGNGHGAALKAGSNERAASVVEVAGAKPRATRAAAKSIAFSLYYFGSYESEFSTDKYDLLIEGARFGDRHGFSAVWVPERHFHSFGGFSPNPSVVAAAIARETERIDIRAGSVVIPLHNPIRVAEEWSVVDNLSRGRVGVSFASGWHPNDFAFAPDAYESRREVMYEGIKTVQKLWRGEPVEVRNGKGKEISVKLSPMPMQRELPTWLTGATDSTFVKGGEIGANFLTNLTDQSVEQLAAKIALYREARARNGFDPETGRVTVLLHSFVLDDFEQARQVAHDPFLRYLKSSLGLSVKGKNGQSIDVNKMSPEDLSYILESGYERHLKTGALIGTPETCSEIVEKLIDAGVDEIGCLVDFGIDTKSALEGLRHLDVLRARYDGQSSVNTESSSTDASNQSDASHVIEATATTATAETPDAGSFEEELEDELEVEYAVPLTEAQRELWIASQMSEDASRSYNESITMRLRGALDTGALHRAIQRLVDRHEALRSTFSPEGDCQIVSASLAVDLPLIDLSGIDVGKREAAAMEWVENEIAQTFDIANGPLARFTILKLENAHHLLHVTNHHLILDGQSWGVLMSDFLALYTSERTGVPDNLPPAVPFREYVERQAVIHRQPTIEKDEAYWLEQFADSVPRLELPLDHPRPLVQRHRGHQLRMNIDGELAARLKQLSVKQRTTILMLLMGAYKTLLHRLSGQDEIIVGIASAGQLTVGEKNIVGYCLNMLPLRSTINDETTFEQHLRAVRRTLMLGYEHQHYSFASLIDKLNLRGDPSRSPLFTAAFDFERAGTGVPFCDLTLDVLPKPVVTARFDLHLVITDVEDGLLLQFTYNTDLFEESTARRWLEHYQTLLEGIVADPQQRVRELPLLTQEQQYQLLVGRNQTQATYNIDLCLQQLFEAQAERTPHATAVIFEDRQLSYAELNRRANRLAHYLRQRGVGADVPVAIMLERSLELPVALLAVLKAGGAYLPLDPHYPQQRLALMLEDTAAPLLLTETSLLDKLPAHHPAVVTLDGDADEIAANSDANPTQTATPQNLAYIIYTSGSTGRPKGVCISHRSIANRILWINHRCPLSSQDRILQKTAFSFDASIWEFFAPLFAGAQLVLARPGGHQDSAYLVDAIRRHRITTLQLVPTMLQVVLDEPGLAECTSLRRLFCGGEALSKELTERVFTLLPGVELHNLYGPTEAAIDATHWECERASQRVSVPIGTPLSNVTVYILDGEMRPVPVGIAGELYIGGVGLARGYWNRAELTAERFIPHPYSMSEGERLYRTGDVARWSADGTVEYVGRADTQVKVRGYRIELGEIEGVLAGHAGVRECAVVVREDEANHKRVVGYVVPRDPGHTQEQSLQLSTSSEQSDVTLQEEKLHQLPNQLEGRRDASPQDGAPGVSELFGFMRERLPEQLVPDAFVMLEALPRLPNGKLDRGRLPEPGGERPALKQNYVAPRDAVEAKLAEIWAEVLDVEQVGVHDNFLELGGHSLLVIQLISRIQAAFDVRLTLRDLFESPTVAQLAVIVALSRDAQTETPDAIKRIDADDEQLMKQLDELSDQEVESLLGDMLTAKEIG